MGNKQKKQRQQQQRAGGGLWCGVDIGGTKLHAVLCTAKGEVVGTARKKTKGGKGFAAVMRRVVTLVGELCVATDAELDQIEAVGVGAPSPILADGTALNAPNLGWVRAPLVPVLEKALGRPVHAANDCDAGTLGEHAFGAGRGARLLAGLFMGTGLGGGLVIDGQIANGANHKAAEVGHMLIEVGGRRCGCGKRGCLEAYASKTGIARHLVHAIHCEGHQSELGELVAGGPSELRSSLLAKAYRGGDELAVAALNQAADYLGYGVGNLITLLGPDVVVLGGGVLEALGEELLDRVACAAQAVSWPPTSFEDTKLELASLGDNAVALGAVAHAQRRTKVAPSA